MQEELTKSREILEKLLRDNVQMDGLTTNILDTKQALSHAISLMKELERKTGSTYELTLIKELYEALNAIPVRERLWTIKLMEEVKIYLAKQATELHRVLTGGKG